MDNDQKLVTLLDSLGEGADVDFAKEVLEAHNWDLEAALTTMTGGTDGGAPASRTGAEEVDAEGYRAPMRTGYRDTLLGPEPATPWDLAFATAGDADASRSQWPADAAVDDVQQALLASRSEHAHRADMQEQGSLAQALESSWALHEQEETRRRSQHIQAESEEQKLLAQAIEASYREQAGGDGAFRSEMEKVLQQSAQSAEDDLELALKQSLEGASHGSPVSTSSSTRQPRASDLRQPAAGLPAPKRRPPASATALGTRVANGAGIARLPAKSEAGSSRLLQKAGSGTVTASAAGSKSKQPSGAAPDLKVVPSAVGAPVEPMQPPSFAPRPSGSARPADEVKPMPVGARPSRGSAAGSATAAVRHYGRNQAPGQAMAAWEAEEADQARRRAEEATKQKTQKTADANQAMPTDQTQAPSPTLAPEKLMSEHVASSGNARAEALAAAESRRRSAAAVEAEQRFAQIAEPSTATSTPTPAEASPVASPSPEPARPVFLPTASVEGVSAEAVSSALVNLRRLHLEVRPSELATCLRTLKAYVGNLASKPLELKFQRIRKDNNAFSSRVACMEGATAVLKACGFEDHEEAWAVDPGYMKSKGPALFDALAKIDVLLNHAESKASAS